MSEDCEVLTDRRSNKGDSDGLSAGGDIANEQASALRASLPVECDADSFPVVVIKHVYDPQDPAVAEDAFFMDLEVHINILLS